MNIYNDVRQEIFWLPLDNQLCVPYGYDLKRRQTFVVCFLHIVMTKTDVLSLRIIYRGINGI